MGIPNLPSTSSESAIQSGERKYNNIRSGKLRDATNSILHLQAQYPSR